MPAQKPNANPRPKPKPQSPSEVTPGVFVGGWKDAVAFHGARFCVLDEAPEGMPAARHLPFYRESADRADPKKLDLLVRAMSAARAEGQPVLVFCGHGVRRSPLGAAWYLHREEGLSLDEAYRRIKAVRPQVEHAREWLGNADELAKA